MENGKNKLEEGYIVLGTVERIAGETVFVDIGKYGKGTIITSEVSPGRIRNLRDYVVPGKKIVCKVLGTGGKNIHLSLRRVSAKEKDKVMREYERKKSSIKILQNILGKEKGQEIAENIDKEEGDIYQFTQKCKEEGELLEKYVKKEESGKILKILEKRKEKQVEVKGKFDLSTHQKNGLEIIKKILGPYEENIYYQSAGKYIVKVKAKDYKKANKKRDEIINSIKEEVREKDIDFEIEEK